MAKSTNLHEAKNAKNDEFYTRLEDVSQELKFYKKHFENKIVFCNCDDPTWSAFWRYFHLNFKKLKLKKLIATHYDIKEPAYKMIYEGGNDKDIEFGQKVILEENGDFRSKECIDILKESDIVVTNPPFSLARDFLACLIKYKKSFLCIGDMNWITYKEVFPLLKDNKIWLGNCMVKEFLQPDGSTKKFGNKLWFTNLDHKKRHKRIKLTEKYDAQKYPHYDNYNAIEVSKLTEIPKNYKGVIGVPITYLDKHNPKQFELIGITSGRKEFSELAYPTKRYINALQHNVDGTIVSGSKANTRACIAIDKPEGTYYTADNSDKKLKIVYARVLIKKI